MGSSRQQMLRHSRKRVQRQHPSSSSSSSRRSLRAMVRWGGWSFLQLLLRGV